MDINNHKFLKRWKKHYKDIFTKMYPQLTKEQLDSFLDEVIEKELVNQKAQIHNNYVHKPVNVDLLTVYDWFEDTKPISAGFGVFFKNQNQELNPAAVMLDNFLKLRKSYKSRLADFPETSYEYATFDRLQATEKVNANSYYGASGAPTSNFFNLYTATSVTATGQSLISTTETSFEAFLANNVLFNDINECFVFIRNIINEKHEMDDSFLPNINIHKVYRRLLSMFCSYKPQIKKIEEEYGDTIWKYLGCLTQRDLNRIYFKNNIYAFANLPRIRNKLTDVMLNVEDFKNPNKVPESIKGKLEDLWDYLKEFVFYNYFAFNRIQRLKTEKRKVVVTVDTDSNMLNLNPWVMFMNNNIINVNDKLADRTYDQLRFISVNMMCYWITTMITEVLEKYTKRANIPKEFRPKINMKNEFLFTRLILSGKKKRYISSIRLREGKEIYPEKVDIKGMDFVKSSTREDTKAYFMKLVKEKLLYTQDIDISEILRELEKFEGIIRESLTKGEKNFLIPKSVKELGAYANPYREQGFRSVLAWNYLYPSNSISLPEKVDMIKVKLTNEKEVEKLKTINRHAYDILMKEIIDNDGCPFKDKGVQVIALPRNVDSIPEWLLPFVDYNTIVNDNISRFYSVLESLGVETMKAGKMQYYSNILKI